MFVNPLGRNPTNYLPYVAFTLSIKGQRHEKGAKTGTETRERGGGGDKISSPGRLIKNIPTVNQQLVFSTQKIVKFDTKNPLHLSFPVYALSD